MNAPTWTDVTAKQVMNRVTAPGMPFRWSINPYRGCAHGCAFCYARSTHTYLGFAADDSFSERILLKRNAAEALERQLDRMAKRHRWNLEEMAATVGQVAIGTATDPYQPAEARARITRSCLEVLARYGVPVSITTRSPLILRDADLLAQMNIHSVNVSISTLDRTVWRAFEPASPAPLRRLEAVRELRRQGVRAGVFLAPVLPGLTDSASDLEDLVRAVSEHDAAFVMASVLRLAPDIKPWFLRALGDAAPKLLPRYRQLYRGANPPGSYTDPLMRRVERLMQRYRLPHLSQCEPGSVNGPPQAAQPRAKDRHPDHGAACAVGGSVIAAGVPQPASVQLLLELED